MLVIFRGIDGTVSHAIQEQLQIGVATGRELHTISSIVGVQSYLHLIGVGQTVTVRINHLIGKILWYGLQMRIAGDVNLLVVLFT